MDPTELAALRETTPDENKGPAVLGACVTVTGVALILVLARMYVRLRVVRSVRLDDYAIMTSMTLSLVSLGIIGAEVSHGCGRHAIYLEPATMMTGLKFNLLSQPFLQWALALVKISLCFSLLRFAPSKAWHRFFWGLIIFIMTYTLLGFFTIMLQCIPLHYLWNPTIKATCMRPTTLWGLIYTVLAVNIVTDLVLAIVPAPILWNLQVQRRAKIALIAVMGTGIFACTAAIVKTAYLPNYGKKGDFLWDSVNITIWTVTECNVGIVAASIPTIKPLLKAFRAHYGSGSHTRPSGNGYEGGSTHKGGYTHRSSGQSMSMLSPRSLCVGAAPTTGDGDSEIIILEPEPGEGYVGELNGVGNGMEISKA